MTDYYLLPPLTIGEYLKTEWLEPLGLSAYRVAKDIGITPRGLLNILNGKRNLSLETSPLLWYVQKLFHQPAACIGSGC